MVSIRCTQLSGIKAMAAAMATAMAVPERILPRLRSQKTKAEAASVTRAPLD